MGRIKLVKSGTIVSWVTGMSGNWMSLSATSIVYLQKGNTVSSNKV